MFKTTKIWVTFQRVGYHCYPNAPSEPFDVTYLKNVHRHLFKFKVTIETFDNEREIEFHQFLNFLESLYTKDGLQLDSKSCETISDELYEKIASKFPQRDIRIEVSEDGECGSDVSYNFNRK